MKKIFLCSLLLVAGLAATSCTADETAVPVHNQMADDTGGQNGNPPPPPPPPPPGDPGTGTGRLSR